MLPLKKIRSVHSHYRPALIIARKTLTYPCARGNTPILILGCKNCICCSPPTPLVRPTYRISVPFLNTLLPVPKVCLVVEKAHFFKLCPLNPTRNRDPLKGSGTYLHFLSNKAHLEIIAKQGPLSVRIAFCLSRSKLSSFSTLVAI